jgi:hypothetical protein
MRRKLLIAGIIAFLLIATIMIVLLIEPRSELWLKLSQATDKSRPFCSLDSYLEHKFSENSQLHTWTLRVSGLKTLTTSLFFIHNGKSQLVSSVEYNWDKWEASMEPANIQLELLTQNGQPFEVSNKRLYLIAMDIKRH